MNTIPPEVALRIIDRLVDVRVWHPADSLWTYYVPGIHERACDVQNALVALSCTNRFWNELASPYLIDHLVVPNGTHRLVAASLDRIRSPEQRQRVRTLQVDLGPSVDADRQGLRPSVDVTFASVVRGLPDLRVLSVVRGDGDGHHADRHADHFHGLSSAAADLGALSGLTVGNFGWPFIGVVISEQQETLRSLELRDCWMDHNALAIIGRCPALETMALSGCCITKGVITWWRPVLQAPLRHLLLDLDSTPFDHDDEIPASELVRFFFPDHVRPHSLSLCCSLPDDDLDALLHQRPSLWSELRHLRLGPARSRSLGRCARMEARNLRTVTLFEEAEELADFVSGLVEGVFRPAELELVPSPGHDRYSDEERLALARTCEQVGTTLFWLD